MFLLNQLTTALYGPELSLIEDKLRSNVVGKNQLWIHEEKPSRSTDYKSEQFYDEIYHHK